MEVVRPPFKLVRLKSWNPPKNINSYLRVNTIIILKSNSQAYNLKTATNKKIFYCKIIDKFIKDTIRYFMYCNELIDTIKSVIRKNVHTVTS